MPELLVALTLAGVLAVETQLVLARASLTLRDRSERFAAEHAVRVSLAAIRAALEAAGRDASDADLAAAGAAGFVVRVTRAAGVVCDTGGAVVTVRAGPGWWGAVRTPVAGRDSVRVATPADTGWRAFALQAAPAPRACPDGSPGLALPLGVAPGGMVQPGSPLLVVEPIEIRRYAAPPDDWLGVRLVATPQPIQPLAGPLGGPGSVFRFEDLSGNPAPGPAFASAGRFVLEVRTERAGGIGVARSPGLRADSVRAFVALGNAW